MAKKTLFSIFSITTISLAAAYTTKPPRTNCINRPTPSVPLAHSSTRKAFLSTLATSTLATTFLTTPFPANSFDGSGSSAYSGKAPTSKAELKKSYQQRVIADVKDFNKLGAAIKNGQTEGDAWVNFFIEYKRREPDSVGRTYAALVDLVGNKELSGCGILLASSFAKPGKPSEGLPSVKKYNVLAKLFDPIAAAGKKGDAEKARVSWAKASDALRDYLEVVELPSSLSDPIYN